MDWYSVARRDLPWRRTQDPYPIWISEIMLQQTRVAAVVPYYEKFLARFPTVSHLAEAPESDVLAHWAGLGYYSRARNLHNAAKRIAPGEFPRTYAEIRELPGIGDYTAAAVASIAFGLPHAAVDGNVLRVIARVANDPSDIKSPKVRAAMSETAQRLLHPKRPGDWNQAMMELGATVCTPRTPACGDCPVSAHCQANLAGTAGQLPVKSRNARRETLEIAILVFEKDGKILLRPSERIKGFWELPDTRSAAMNYRPLETLGAFTHQITFRKHLCTVSKAALIRSRPAGLEWIDPASVPLTTMTRKALELVPPVS